MSATTKIEWTRGDDGAAGATWNPVTGCSKVSEGCDNCYAETFAERWRGVPGHPFEQGFDLRLWPDRLTLPLRWRKPRRVFLNSMSDLAHEAVPTEFVARVFAVMASAQRHTFQVLTKRPARLRALLRDVEFRELVARHVARLLTVGQPDFPVDPGEVWPLPNVWVGVSAETQKWASVRIPVLVETAAAVRFVSCEPLLGRLDLSPWLAQGLEWVIVGGESGPGARPMHPDWARSLRDQCRAAQTPFFFKQWGEWTDTDHGLRSAGDYDALLRRCTGNNRVNGHRMRELDGVIMVRLGKHKTGRELDGQVWDSFPAPASAGGGHG